MRIREKKAIKKWADGLTNEELEKAYYDSIYDVLGSDVDIMFRRGCSQIDIDDYINYKKYVHEKHDYLEQLCLERGIVLWQ